MNIAFSPFPELKTERLLLRRLTSADVNELMQLRSDDRVNQYLDRARSMNMDEASAFVAKIDQTLADSKGCYWVIGLKENPALTGTVCLWNFEPEKNQVEIGYELSPVYLGKGIMLEAVKKVIEYAFEAMQAQAITAITHPDNAPSKKVLERCGFKQDVDDEDGMKVYILNQDSYIR